MESGLFSDSPSGPVGHCTPPSTLPPSLITREDVRDFTPRSVSRVKRVSGRVCVCVCMCVCVCLCVSGRKSRTDFNSLHRKPTDRDVPYSHSHPGDRGVVDVRCLVCPGNPSSLLHVPGELASRPSHARDLRSRSLSRVSSLEEGSPTSPTGSSPVSCLDTFLHLFPPELDYEDPGSTVDWTPSFRSLV